MPNQSPQGSVQVAFIYTSYTSSRRGVLYESLWSRELNWKRKECQMPDCDLQVYWARPGELNEWRLASHMPGCNFNSDTRMSALFMRRWGSVASGGTDSLPKIEHQSVYKKSYQDLDTENICGCYPELWNKVQNTPYGHPSTAFSTAYLRCDHTASS